MTARASLGPADVSDEELTRMVAALLEVGPATVSLVSAQATPVDYEIPAITTASRNWVRGTATVGGRDVPFSLFVKHVQSWARSPLFETVPVEIRDFAEATVPWRTEALVYRSDLATKLPAGLAMPRAVGVFDLDEKSAAVWLEDIPAIEVDWDLPRFVSAAHLLGRLAGSPALASYARVGEFDWTVRNYLDGRLANQVVPMLHVEQIWQHPLVAGAFDTDLQRRIVHAADSVTAYAEELMAFPVTAGHGDACPNNLLVREGADGFTLIDFGFWQALPIGFDLGQLLVGDVQIGRRDSTDLAVRDEACLRAYLDGLHQEGFQVAEPDVRRAHALQLLLFTGLSTVPFEHLEVEPTAALAALSAERAAIARYSLDLVDATA